MDRYSSWKDGWIELWIDRQTNGWFLLRNSMFIAHLIFANTTQFTIDVDTVNTIEQKKDTIPWFFNLRVPYLVLGQPDVQMSVLISLD